MLNRRTLRVKAMQAMFAFEQCKEANFNVAIETLEESFQQDLNSMEIQDPIELDTNKKASIALFKKNVVEDPKTDFKSDSEIVSIETEKTFNTYQVQVKKDFKQVKKQMVVESEGIYDRYIKILNLLLRFSNFAEQGVGSKKSKVGEQSNLVNNLLIQYIKNNKELEVLSLKMNLGWNDEIEIIRDWFKEIIVKDPLYVSYLSEMSSKKNDYEILNHIVRKIVFKNESILNYWETLDINWVEDEAVIRSLVIKTLKSLLEKGKDFELAILSYNWEEDKEFFEKLFESTIKDTVFLQKLIAEKTKNWEFDRIAYTDRLILMLAISEMMHFPSIPIKVTINEFIEVSKTYSTPKSKQFVNGVLDVIAVDLQEKGLIKKSGRGLIDNK